MSILILSDLIIGVLDVAFLGTLLLIISFYTRNNAPHHPLLPAWLSHQPPLVFTGVFFLLFSLKNLAAYLISDAQSSFFYQVSSRLSRQNIWHYLKADYISFTHIGSSVMIRRISQQPIEFSNYILTNVQQVIAQGILVCCTIAAILLYHPVLFFSLFLLLLPPVILLGYFIRRKMRHIRMSTKITSEKTLQHLQESLAGYVESNLYDKNNFFVNRYHSYQQQLNDNIATQQSLQSLPPRLIEIFAVLGFFILISINQWASDSPFTDVLTIGIFMAAAYKIIPGVVKIMNSSGQIRTYAFVMKDLLPGEQLKVEHQPAKQISTLNFEGVSFSYPFSRWQRQVLRNCCFELKAGDFAGISGKSGIGKTTVINLILGFLQQDSGKVCINQEELTPAARQDYWQRISYVKQQPFLINDTLLKNITLSDEGYDQQKLTAILQQCGISRMLEHDPEGMAKMITEQGKNISGGQRQRIMLARALYHDFDLLILDEPFSELDEPAEHELLTLLATLAGRGKMILMITHHQNSLNFCNKILTLNEN